MSIYYNRVDRIITIRGSVIRIGGYMHTSFPGPKVLRRRKLRAKMRVHRRDAGKEFTIRWHLYCATQRKLAERYISS